MSQISPKYKSLGQLCTRITDGTHKTPVYRDEGVIFISAKNVKDGRLDFTDRKYISQQEHDFLTKSSTPTAGDLLLTKSGSLGEAAAIPKLAFEFSIFESLALLKPKSELVTTQYLHQYLCSPVAARYYQSITTGLAVKHLHLGDLRKLKVFLPPLPKQEEIANLLSTWDLATDKTKLLISARETLYALELSRLIEQDTYPRGQVGNSTRGTDRTRKVVALADIATVWKGKQLNRDAMIESGAYYALNGGINPSGRTTDWNCDADTITISEGGNSFGYVSLNREKFWCGGHCYAIKNLAKNVHAHFLFHYLKGRQTRLMALRVGSGLPNIQKSDIETFPVVLPDLGRQAAIAHYLNTQREEISTLSVYVDRLKEQKRGLMQKLLTGQWRVPMPSSEASEVRA